MALGLLILALAAPAQARRVALVIGNDSYQNVQPLKNARADAGSWYDKFQTGKFQMNLGGGN